MWLSCPGVSYPDTPKDLFIVSWGSCYFIYVNIVSTKGTFSDNPYDCKVDSFYSDYCSGMGKPIDVLQPISVQFCPLLLIAVLTGFTCKDTVSLYNWGRRLIILWSPSIRCTFWFLILVISHQIVGTLWGIQMPIQAGQVCYRSQPWKRGQFFLYNYKLKRK